MDAAVVAFLILLLVTERGGGGGDDKPITSCTFTVNFRTTAVTIRR